MTQLMRAVAFKSPGLVTDLYVSSTTPIPVLKSSECLVKVVYSGLNRADLQQRRGLYPPPPGASEILGLEAVGRVVKCHDDGNASSWKPGDRVMCLLSGGGQAEYVATHQANMIRIPDWMDWRQAACVPEAWLTAFQLLYWVSQFTRTYTDMSDKRVLVHAGASGVGTSLIQMLTRVLKVGAVYATVGSEDKREYLESKLNVTKAINYKTTNFSERILELTGQRGVDLVFDCVGGEYWEKNVACLALDGEWVLYGLLSGGKVDGDLLARMMRKRASLKTTTLRNRSVQYKQDLMLDFEKRMLPHFQSGLVETIFDSEFDLEKIGEAHARMESNANTGKILVKVSDDNDSSKNQKSDL